jgi:ABC-type uncharacterized transport system ATPase component
MVEIVTILASIGGILTIAYGYVKIMGKTAVRNITEEEAEQICAEIFAAAKDGKLTQEEISRIVYKILNAVSTK